MGQLVKGFVNSSYFGKLDYILPEDCAPGSGPGLYASGGGRALGLDLVAHGADMLGLGPDEGDVVPLEDLGEAGALGANEAANAPPATEPGGLPRPGWSCEGAVCVCASEMR